MDVIEKIPHVKPIPTIIPQPVQYQTYSHDGSRALWVGFVVMVVAALVFSILAWRIPIQRRLFHVTSTIIAITAAVSYFSMASKHSLTLVCRTLADEHGKGIPDTYHDVCRSVFWSRYVDWAITTPLLFLNLGLVAGIPGGNTLVAASAGLLAVLAAWFSAIGNSKDVQVWGWFIISVISYIVAVGHLALHGTAAVKNKSSGTRKLFAGLSVWTLALFVVYLVIWGTANGCRQINVDTEIITYLVLDILAKVGFSIGLLRAQRTVPETQVQLGGYWSHGLASDGRVHLPTEDEEA